MQKIICRCLIIVCSLLWIVAFFINQATIGTAVTSHEPAYTGPLMITAQVLCMVLPFVIVLAIIGFNRSKRKAEDEEARWRPPAPKV